MILRRLDMRGKDIFKMSSFPFEVSTFEYQSSSVSPIEETSELMIVIDPSKTESGVTVATIYGEVLEILTMSGVYSDHREDTMDFCRDCQMYYMQRFGKANVKWFCKESTIMKKGTEYYTSMKVLESISTVLDDTAKMLVGKNAFGINNWAWKSHVLPDGYRSQKEKGSYIWMCELNPAIRQLTDNITDSYCMYLYMRDYIVKCASLSICCNAHEEANNPYTYVIINTKNIPEGVQEFIFNSKYDIKENCNYYINRSNKPGYCKIDINTVLAEEIYGHSYEVLPHSPIAVLVVEGDS